MKLTVLGASGGIGKHLVTHALADGHQVRAVVRDPARLTMQHDRLEVAVADALDAASLTPVVEGTDAVLSGMGAQERRDPLNPASTSARAASEAMAATGVRRLLVVSAGPLNRSGAGQPLLAHRLLAPLLWRMLREVYTDLERMEAQLRSTGLHWTSVRPPRLVDGPGQGRYRHTLDAGPSGTAVARTDVARAMLDFVPDRSTFGRAVGVSR